MTARAAVVCATVEQPPPAQAALPKRCVRVHEPAQKQRASYCVNKFPH
jgi:hypothetical protein